ncbi:MAG: hypothetical protein AAF799_27020 [Myxococcota bacterium]
MVSASVAPRGVVACWFGLLLGGCAPAYAHYTKSELPPITARLTDCPVEQVVVSDPIINGDGTIWDAHCAEEAYRCSKDPHVEGCSPGRDAKDRREASGPLLGCAPDSVEISDEHVDGPIDTWTANCGDQRAFCRRDGGVTGRTVCGKEGGDTVAEPKSEWSPIYEY